MSAFEWAVIALLVSILFRPTTDRAVIRELMARLNEIERQLQRIASHAESMDASVSHISDRDLRL